MYRLYSLCFSSEKRKVVVIKCKISDKDYFRNYKRLEDGEMV